MSYMDYDKDDKKYNKQLKLIKAIKEGDLAKIRNLAEAGVDLNYDKIRYYNCNSDVNWHWVEKRYGFSEEFWLLNTTHTPLTIATNFYPNEEVIKLLVELGAVKNAQ